MSSAADAPSTSGFFEAQLDHFCGYQGAESDLDLQKTPISVAGELPVILLANMLVILHEDCGAAGL